MCSEQAPCSGYFRHPGEKGESEYDGTSFLWPITKEFLLDVKAFAQEKHEQEHKRPWYAADER